MLGVSKAQHHFNVSKVALCIFDIIAGGELCGVIQLSSQNVIIFEFDNSPMIQTGE